LKDCAVLLRRAKSLTVRKLSISRVRSSWRSLRPTVRRPAAVAGLRLLPPPPDPIRITWHRCKRVSVSICTFVPIKQVNWVPGAEYMSATDAGLLPLPLLHTDESCRRLALSGDTARTSSSPSSWLSHECPPTGRLNSGVAAVAGEPNCCRCWRACGCGVPKATFAPAAREGSGVVGAEVAEGETHESCKRSENRGRVAWLPADSRAALMHARLLRQYLYFCTSKASKLSTCQSQLGIAPSPAAAARRLSVYMLYWYKSTHADAD
jgi:hypothetical protein